MTFSILERGESFIQKRKKRRRFTVAFGCLAVVAAVGTGYALKRNGTAVNYEYRELTCTYEVHEHTDECYDAEGELICGKADYVIHVHNDDCYDKDGELVCTLPEIEAHQHEESCFEEMPVLICEEEGIEQNEISEEAEADNKTAVEEAQPPKTDNAAAFNGDVSGNDAAQTASNSEETADTEATGSTETAVEATPDDSRETAEASAENASDEDMAADAPTADEAAEAEPEISAGAEESAEPEKAAGAEETTAPEEPNVHVHTEECYELQMVPTCGQLELHTHTEDCYDEEGNLICGLLELEEHVHDENCFKVLEPAAGTRTYEGEDYTVTVTYGVDAGLPETVEFSAEEIKPGTYAYQNYRKQALEELGTEAEEESITSGRIFDMKFTLEGEEIEPKATVNVEITYHNEESGILIGDPKVVHFAGEEEIPEVIDATEQEGTYSFSADGFSPIYLGNTEVPVEKIQVRIRDNLAEDGCLYAEPYYAEEGKKPEECMGVSVESIKNAGYTVELTWFRGGPEIPDGVDPFTELNENNSNLEGVELDGEKLNVLLNQENCGAGCKYKVRLWIKENGNEKLQFWTGEYRTPYDELKNGNFEMPTVGSTHRHVPVGEKGLYWKTVDNSAVEIIRIQDNGTVLENYGWDADNGQAKDANGGRQFAEINSTNETTLYQTVQTEPGTRLNWEFFHRARGEERATMGTEEEKAEWKVKTEYDEMYLVIMPENVAKQYDGDHNRLKTYLGVSSGNTKGEKEEAIEFKRGESEVDGSGVSGIQIVRIMSDDKDWHQCNGVYTVPEGQYFTRFFFVAGRTHYDKSIDGGNSNPGSKGNFIDKIWFSTRPAPGLDECARLTIKKYVYGMTEEDFEKLKLDFHYTINTKNGNTKNDNLNEKNFIWTKQSDCWVGVKTIDVPLDEFANDQSSSISEITEQFADMWESGYQCRTEVRAGKVTRTVGSADSTSGTTGGTVDWVWSGINPMTGEKGAYVTGKKLPDAISPVNEEFALKKQTGENGNTVITDVVAEFVNDYSLYNKNLKIVKTAQDGTTKLNEAEFTVEIGGKSYNVSTGGENVSEGITKGSNGEVTIQTDGLQFGQRYSLTETKAPGGYVGLKDKIFFELSKVKEGDNYKIQTTFYDVNGKVIDDASISANSPKVPGYQGEPTDPVTITVRNDVQVSLPETGGTGTEYYRYISIALLAAGLIYGYSIWKKRERRAS